MIGERELLILISSQNGTNPPNFCTPKNITSLLTSEIKIADFGFAKQAKSDHALSTMCGTPGYVAPEVLRKEKYGTKADMWSMGVIIFIMLGTSLVGIILVQIRLQ